MKFITTLFLFLSTISYSQTKHIPFNKVGNSTYSVLRMEDCLSECKKITCDTWSIEVRIYSFDPESYDVYADFYKNGVGEVIYTDLATKQKTVYTITSIDSKNQINYQYGEAIRSLTYEQKYIRIYEEGYYYGEANMDTKYFLK